MSFSSSLSPAVSDGYLGFLYLPFLLPLLPSWICSIQAFYLLIFNQATLIMITSVLPIAKNRVQVSALILIILTAFNTLDYILLPETVSSFGLHDSTFSGFFTPPWLLCLSPFACFILIFWPPHIGFSRVQSSDVFPILPTLTPIQTHGFKYLLSSEDSQIHSSGLKLSNGLDMHIITCCTLHLNL